MVAMPVSVDTGMSVGDDIQWGAGQDSFYEVILTPPSALLITVSNENICAMAEFEDCIISRSVDKSRGKYHDKLVKLESPQRKRTVFQIPCDP